MSGKSGMRNSGGGIAAPGGAAARSAAGAMRLVRLGDVAEEVRENWNGPTTDVPVVGLEHIEPDEMWLRKWEVNPDENTFSKAFRKGQLLFGRRRAYQKKLSLAPSDGICSGDITVIAAKSDKVVPSLLPFLLRTDKFFDYAIQGSAGSLSPRVKWAHLAKYEFDLPTMDEQKKLAELLWAANDLKESYKKAITATDEMLKAKFREYISGVDVEVRPFGELSESLDGRRIPVKSGDRKAGVYPYYGASGVVDYVDSYIFDEEILLVSEDGANLTARTTPIAFSVSGKCWVNNHAHVVKFQEKATQKFVEYYIELTDISPYITGTAQPKLNKEKLNRIPIPLPPLALQREFVAIADKAESAKANLKKSIAAIDLVMKGLING